MHHSRGDDDRSLQDAIFWDPLVQTSSYPYVEDIHRFIVDVLFVCNLFQYVNSIARFHHGEFRQKFSCHAMLFEITVRQACLKLVAYGEAELKLGREEIVEHEIGCTGLDVRMSS